MKIKQFHCFGVKTFQFNGNKLIKANAMNDIYRISIEYDATFDLNDGQPKCIINCIDV